MTNKLFSLIIIPHSKLSPKSFTLTEKAIKIILGFSLFLFVLFVVFLVDYFSVNGIRREYKKLYSENLELSQTIAEYKVSVNKLKATVEHFENYTEKLNIMAGLKSPDALKEVGIGGGSSNDNQVTSSENFPQDISLSYLKNINQKAEGIEKNLNTLVNFFKDQSIRLAFTPSIAPTRGYLSSPFGWRDDPFTGKRTFHYGIDIATQTGNPVVATADGLVVAEE